MAGLPFAANAPCATTLSTFDRWIVVVEGLSFHFFVSLSTTITKGFFLFLFPIERDNKLPKQAYKPINASQLDRLNWIILPALEFTHFFSLESLHHAAWRSIWFQHHLDSPLNWCEGHYCPAVVVSRCWIRYFLSQKGSSGYQLATLNLSLSNSDKGLLCALWALACVIL